MSAHIPGGAEQRRAERKARPDEARTYHSVICKTAAAVSGMRHGGTGGAFKLLHSTRASTDRVHAARFWILEYSMYVQTLETV